jgi:hypothetical protein
MKYQYVEIIRNKNNVERSFYYVHQGAEEDFMVKLCDVISLINFSLKETLFHEVLSALGFMHCEHVTEPSIVVTLYI